MAPRVRARVLFIPQLCCAGLLGSGRGGGGRVGGWVAIRAWADFFLSRALPTFIFALLQAVRGWQTQTRTVLIRLRQKQYWLLMKITNHRT